MRPSNPPSVRPDHDDVDLLVLGDPADGRTGVADFNATHDEDDTGRGEHHRPVRLDRRLGVGLELSPAALDLVRRLDRPFEPARVVTGHVGLDAQHDDLGDRHKDTLRTMRRVDGEIGTIRGDQHSHVDSLP